MSSSIEPATAKIGAGIAAWDRQRRNSTPAKARARKIGSSWRPDDELEGLLRMKKERPEAFDRLPAATRMSLGYYENGKAAAQEAGLDPEAA